MAVVFEQHHGLRGNLCGKIAVSGVVDASAAFYLCESGALDHKPQHVGAGSVQHLHVERAVVCSSNDQCRIFCAAGHVDIVARVDLFCNRAARSPVGHDHALKAAFLSQVRGQQIVGQSHARAVDEIVRGHDGIRGGIAHRHAERLEVDLTQRALGYVCADRSARGFLIVGGKVLKRNAHARGLNALRISRSDIGGQ